jgi:autotransporter-associated beta strand protein
VTALLLVCFSAWTVKSGAADGSWNVDANGNWTAPGNWLGGIIPNGVGDVASFTNDLSAARTITLNAPITLGGFRLGDALGGSIFTFAGGSAMTFNNGASSAFFNKFGGATDVWQAPLILAGDLAWNLFAGILDVNGASNAQASYTGSGDTIKNGSGTLRLNPNTGALGAGYTGDWIMNLGTLNLGGPNTDTSFALGTGTGGIVLNGSGRADLAIFSLNNNGLASDSLVTYQGNNDVFVQGGARLNVDRNWIAGVNDRVTHVLDQLTFRGGILQVTSGNGHALRFSGATTLQGAQNVFDVGASATPTRANLELTGAVIDGGAGRNLVKEGAGRLHLQNASNQYGGLTAVKDGVLSLGPGAKVGSGGVVVNGGAVSVPDVATLNGISATSGGLRLVAQLGTSRFALPVVGYYGAGTIDGFNPMNFSVPVGGAIFGLDGMAGTASESFATIDMNYVGGGSDRVWFGNVTGFDRFFRGTVFNSANFGMGDLRITSGGSTLVFDTTENAIGGAGAMNAILFGFDHQNAIGFTGNTVTQAAAGTVSVRVNNSSSLGNVTVNRGVTVNINGAITSPLGAAVVTGLGGAITTDATSAAQFGNTDFRLFGGSSLTLDNSAVTVANADRRLAPITEIDLTSSTLRLIGDGGAATISSQAVSSIDFAGGSTLSVDTDGAVAGRLTTLSTGSLSRVSRGTLVLRNIANTATTFGTAAGTQKLIVTSAPTVTNDMIGANFVLWGGANAADSSQPLFTTYDATHGVQAATFDVTTNAAATLAAATSDQIVDLSGLTASMTVTTGNVQALRIRSTSATSQSVNTGTITIGSAAAAGQGAGLFLAHTSNDGITHSASFAFGTQEGLVYAATTGGTAGVITLSGGLSGSNGITRFGDGILNLTGTNPFTGPLNLNSGETRLNRNAAGSIAAATGSINPAAPMEINLWGGSLYLNEASQRLNANVNFFNDARFGDVNVAASAANNLTIQPRTGSSAPVVAWFQDQAGGNFSTFYGSLVLNGPAQLAVVHPVQVNAGISGTGSLERFMNDRLYVGGDSSGYSQPVTAYAGSFQSLNAGGSAKPFGTGPITLNPGSAIRLAAASNVSPGQVAIRSDLGGISGLGLTFNADPVAALSGLGLSIQSSAPWKGFFGVGSYAAAYTFDQTVSGLWGGDVYLGSVQGDLGVFTGTLIPTASNQFLLGAGQGTLRIARALSGANTAVIGVSMTGEQRADQVVNNSGGVTQFDVPMTYTGETMLNANILRLHHPEALAATGDLIANGGQLRADTNTGQIRFNAPIDLSNRIRMMGDLTVQMENAATDFILNGNVSLSAAAGSTGLVRNFNVGVDGNNAGNLILNGGIIDGAGSTGGHFVKGGYGTLFLGGANTFTGTLTVAGGLLGVNGDADFGSASQVILPGGGLGIFENSFTSSRNLTFTTGNGWLDVAGGLTFTQAASSTYDGPAFIMKRGLGTVVLNGTNAQTGVLAADGVIQFNSQAAIGNASQAGASDFQLGGDFSPAGGTASRHMGGSLRFNFTGATNRGVTANNNGSNSLAGGLDVTAGNTLTMNGVIQAGTEFDFLMKTGPGTLVTTGTNTTRQFAMIDGTHRFGNNAPWGNSTGTAADGTNIEMLGGVIHASNTTADISLANGASTTNYRYGGGTRILMTSGAGFDITLNTDNLSRRDQGTLVLSTAAGTVFGGAVDSNSGRVISTNAINDGLARASALNNGIFAAHLVGADANGTGFFLTDNPATGFVPYFGPFNTTLVGLAPTAVAEITSAQVLSGTNSIYAFSTTADVAGGTLRIGAIDNVRDGGILINGSNTISSNLVFDPTSATAPGTGTVAEGLVYVKSGETATISGNITANAFTKFGNGTLVLGGTNQIAGDVSIQAGTLRLGGGSPFSVMNSELNLNAGATLDLNGTNVTVETLGGNNRAVNADNLGVVGGRVTNTGGTQATLAIAATTATPAQNFAGTIDGNLRLMKSGTSVFNIDGYHASTPDAGNNTFTGGVAIYGLNQSGGINLNNSTFGLGGFGGSSAGAVDLYSGALGLLYSGNWLGVPAGSAPLYNNHTVKIGAESGPGITVNVRGNSLINVNQVAGAAIGQGNLMQIGNLNVSNNTLQLSGGNLYRLKVAGTTTIEGPQATFQVNSDSIALQLDGLVTGGVLNRTGDGALRTLILSNPGNNFAGLNIQGGDVQNPNPSANTLGSGPVRVFPDGTLRLAGNGSVNGANLSVLSRVNALGAVMLDENFSPTVLNSANFSSLNGTTLQLGQQMFTGALNLAAIGDGRAFLGSGLNIEGKYLAPTLGAGAADAWNPGVGVYRLVGGVNNLAFEGPNNVLTGNSYLQVGVPRQNVLGTITNTANAVIIRNSNNFTGGTQIAEASILLSEIGGSPEAETPVGSGAVEIYGEYRIQGSLGSNWNAGTSSELNAITLRPGGLVRLIDGNTQGSGGNLVAGGQGRWGDSVGIDLNGGQFRFDGAGNWSSVETIGDVLVRKGGIITVARASTASSAQLNLGNIDRIDAGTLTINYNTGFLGTNLTTPLSFERLTATQIDGVAIASARGGATANGAGVVNGGIIAPWIVDQVAHTFVGFDPTGTGTGFQPLLSTGTPAAGSLEYSQRMAATGTFITGLPSTAIPDVVTGAQTLGDNPSIHALRSAQNISPTATFNTLTLNSGGLLLNGGTINPTGAVTAGVVSPMTLNFGAAGAGEALVYVGSAAATVQAQIVAAQGLTKFGGQALNLNSINPGIGGPVTLNAGTITARVPFSGTGTPLAAGNGVFGGRDVILNGGALQLDSFLANAAGTASVNASDIRATAVLDSNLFVRGDATLGNNGQATYARIPNLTFENGGGASAMNGNGVIALALQSGIWAQGTTTLIPQAVFNNSFNGFSQSTFAGLVVENGVSDLEKYGNGAITLLNGANTYSGGTTIWGTTNATAVSTVASGFRGTGTPFGTGAVTVNPGGLLRIADNANIASNAVTLRSDGIGLAGFGLAHNNPVPATTTGAAAPGTVRVETTGPYAGVLTLDYGFRSAPLDMGTLAGGAWWLGNSTQSEAYYFARTLGAASNGRYLLGGGGNQSGINFGSVSVGNVNTRTALFENLFTGGTVGAIRVEIGALTDDLAANGPSFVNGNSAFITMVTRNTGLVGDTRVNTNTTLALGNNFALGSGRLVFNGGAVRYDFGPNNGVTSNVTLDNPVVLQGDLSTSSGNELVLDGNVAMHGGSAGAARVWGLGGTGAMAVGLTAGSSTNGVISGADGSNLIKNGGQTVSFRGANTYQGYTQVNQGQIVVVGNVAPGVAGPLGISDSAIILAANAANAGGGLSIGGKYSISRDILISQVNGTGTSLIENRTNETAVISGGVSVVSGATLLLGGLGLDNGNGRGGVLEMRGPVSGAGIVRFGTTATAPNANGPVALAGNVNGFGINTYSGGSIFETTRVQIGADTLFSGPASSPTIVSGPLGTGSMTWNSGEAGNGFAIEALGGPRTVVNAFAATASAANSVVRFMGREALTFTRNWNMSSDATLRNRVIVTNNTYQPLSFSGNFSASGAEGANFVKQGPGLLILSGSNTQTNILVGNGNYGTAIFIDGGIVRVGSDASLGGTTPLAASVNHLEGNHADVRLRGGTLSVSASLNNPLRQYILTAASGIDVAAGQTFTMAQPTQGAFGLTKTGPGTLALNNSANTLTTLTLGGAQQINPTVGLFSHTGGTVSTTAVSGTPFAVTSATLNSGTLSLVGGAVAQALSIPTINYGPSGAIALNQGTTTSQLTAATALARTGAFNSVNYGTLTIRPSALANLGNTEKILVTTGAPANTTLGAGATLTTPSVFVALAGVGQDANFARYDATNGLMAHNADLSTSLAVTAPLTLADITGGGTVGTNPGDVIDVFGLRTDSNIGSVDGSQLLRLNGGGLILNGAAGPVISANTLFGTGAGSGLREAVVHVRDGQSGPAFSAISGNVSALDFTKTGPGALELSGSANTLNTNAARLPVLSVQDGTLRFASAAAFTNANRPAGVNTLLGNFVLNVNEAGVFDLNGLATTTLAGLSGNGTVTSNLAGSSNLRVANGFGVDTTFSGSISDGAGSVSLTKTGNGILTLTGHGAHSGGTVVESGRVTNSFGSTAANGRLEAQKMTALGTGPIFLLGGTLRLNATTYLNGAQAPAETFDGIDSNLWGGPNGYNITVPNTAFAQGIALPANVTSTLSATTQNASINSLTVGAPILSVADGLFMVRGATSFSAPDTVLRAHTSGRLFLGGRVTAAGTLTKTGANDVVLTHTEGGAEQNSVGLWKIYGGILNPRVANGAANPLGANPTVEINGGNTASGLFLNSDGDGTGAAEMVTTFAETNLRFGSNLAVSSNQFVSSSAGRIQIDRVVGNNDDKTFVVNNLESAGALGASYVFVTGGNAANLFVKGATTFARDFFIQNDLRTTLNGLISGNGTFVKRAGSDLFINADNTTGYKGGTILGNAGTTVFGSLEGNQVTLSDTARLGGQVIINPNARLLINGLGNVQAGQTFTVGGNLTNFGVLGIGADVALDAIGYRAAGAGGIQNGPLNYYTSATNPSGSVLAINTVYTQPLDQRALGGGMGYLGSTTNYVGANGLYDAASLHPGAGNTYRLGAGGSTLFLGLSNANVLANVNAATPSSLVVGAPLIVDGNNEVLRNGSGTVVLLNNNNFTGATFINRLSTLDVRGTLATSGIENYGTLNIAGEAGTLVGAGSVTNRPGSVLRLDNTSAGVLPVSSAQGRWVDATGVALNSSTLRLQGNTAVETQETVGAITAQGGSFLDIVRGVVGRGTELRTPSIGRVGNGTIQFNTNDGQLGSDERLLVTGAAPVVTNGMVAPWLVTATNSQFLTYNATTGFTAAGFSRNQGAATLAATVSAPADRTIFSGAVVLNAGVDFETWGLRLDGDVTLGTATDNTAQLVLGSGGLLATGTRAINAGIVAGSIASPGELLLWNSGTTTIGDLAEANRNTSGQIIASSLTKFGAGQFNLSASQQTFSGNIRVQQGDLVLRYANGTETNPVSTAGGVGSTIFLEAPNGTFFLRGGQDNLTGNVTFNNSVVLGDFNPIVQVNVDRQGGGITNRRNIIANNFTFGANNTETGQIVRYTGGNTFDLQIGSDASDNLTLAGKSTFQVTTVDADVFVAARATGAGQLIMGGGAGLVEMVNVTNLNNYSGGTTVMGSTLRVRGIAPNVAANTNSNLTSGGLGTGTVTLLGGTLSLLVDGGNDADIENVRLNGTGNGVNLVIAGGATINVDRHSTGSNKHLTFGDLTIGSQILTTTHGNTFGLTIGGTTTMQGNLFLNNTGEFVLNGAVNDGGAGMLINKIGTGTLWVNSTNNALRAPVYINSGGLDFGNRAAANTTATLGTGTIFVNPNSDLRIRAATNINTALGQDAVLTGTSYSPAALRMLVGTALTQAQIQAIVRNRTATITSNENVLIVFEGGTLNQALDQSTIGTGRVHFANVGDRTYAAASLVPGLANLSGSVIGGASTNRVYRLGGRTTNTLTIDLSGAGNLNDVGGATDLQVGSLANLGASGNWGLGQVLLNDQNTYTGQTIVSRGSILRFSSATNVGDTAGPLGAPGSSLIDVYGTLQVEGTAGTFRNNLGTANAYSNISLRPGASLVLLNNNATTNSNRWQDTAGINLDGARFTLDAASNVDLSAETIGSVTFDRGARIQTVNEGTSEILLTAASVTRAAPSAGAGSGRGTMVFTPASSANLGLPSTTNNAEQVRFTAAPTASAVSAVAGMLPGYYIEGTGNRFVTHGANGITPVADGSMVGFSAGMTAGTAVVNVTAAANLPDFNPVIYGLRIGAFALSSPTGANNDATITFGGSDSDVGGVLATGAATIHPNLRFGASGTNEALFYIAGNTRLNGNLTAGGVTKFGTANLELGNDQSDAARGIGNGYSNGWVVNEGALNVLNFGALGNAVGTNTVVLNGNQSSTPTLFLRSNPADSLLNYSYTSGRIIAVDNAVIDYDPGADDRVHSIADIEIQQSGGIGAAPANGTNDAQLRIVNNRQRNIVAAGQLILSNNAILNVDSTYTGNTFAAASNNAAYLTNGGSNGMSVASLAGSARLTKWGDGYLYIRGDSSAYSGSVVIDQGAIGVAHANALGSGAVTVNRYGVLDIHVPGFTKSLTYNEGSVERWSVDGARTGTVNLGRGSLQVGADQNQTVTVTLNGGSIEGWSRTDEIANLATSTDVGLFRNLGANVGIDLAGDSFVGNPYFLGANGLDSGRQINDFRPTVEAAGTGTTLVIQGTISGVGRSLTKIGFDTVILAGANTYDGGTVVSGGVLKLGRNDALATAGSLSTHANGVLDLNGYNQNVGSLTNPADLVTNVSATNNGYITNSAYGVRTLTAGNASNSTYRGVIQHNVALAKAGSGNLRLTNDNTYLGATTAAGGVLEVAGRLSGTSVLNLNPAGRILLNSSTGANDIVNTSADVVFNGGALDLDDSQSNKTQTFRDLSVLGLSELDFGAGTGNTFLFDKLAALIDALKVYNWSGTAYPISAVADSGGPTQDRLLFRSNPGFSANTAINNVVFYNNLGVSYARGLQVTDGSNFGIVPTTMPVAYWTGGVAGNAWNAGNWSSDLGGTSISGSAPNGTTDVVVSAQTQTGKDGMVLGENMQVNSLTVNNSVPGTPVVLQSTGGYTLTINAPAAIVVASGAPAATVNTPVQFSAATATVSVDSTNGLVLAGAVGGTAVTKTGTGALMLTAANAYTGATNINGGTLQLGNGGASGAIETGSAITVASGAIFSVNRSNLVTQGTDFSGAPISGNGAFRQAGSGTTELNAANSYSGGTQIDGGILRLASAQAIGTTGTVRFGGGTLQHTASNAVDYSSRIGDSTAAIRIDTNGQNVSFSANLAATNTGGLVKSGAGTLTMSGTNAFSGATEVLGGTLSVSSEANLGTAPGGANAAHLLLNGGTLETTASFAIDDANRGVTIGAAGATVNTAASTALTVENAIVLSGNLTKAGSGALLVNGTSTGTGTVSVTAGTLGGDGIISGATTIGSGAAITAGTAGTVASLSFTDDLSVGAGSTWLVDFIAGTVDFVSVGDTLNLGGSLSITDDNSWTPLSVFNIAGFNTLGGMNRFSNAFNDGDRVGNFTVNYGTVNAGYITLTAIPEPGTLGLLGLALGGFFVRRLRKRRSEVVAVAAENRE